MKWTPEQVGEATAKIGDVWIKVPAHVQRQLFCGAVPLGRKEVKRSSLYPGIVWRERAGRDRNGMPRFAEHYMSYQVIAESLNRLNRLK